MSLRPTHSRAEAPTPAPQHVMVQADKAFKEAIQMRSSGWSPDSTGPASTDPQEKRALGYSQAPRDSHLRGSRGEGPRGTPGPQAATVHAHLWVLPCRPGQMETVSRAVHCGRSHLKMAQPHKARAASWQRCLQPASPGRVGRGRGQQHGWG